MKKFEKTENTLNKETQWKVFTAVMGTFAIIISVAFAVTGFMYGQKEKDFVARLDDLYTQSYYDLMYSLSGMETDLSKLEVSNDVTQQMMLLSSLTKLSEMASEKLVYFGGDNNFVNFIKYTNQVGDYSYYLMSKLNRGDKITDKEYEVIADFVKIAGEVKGELAIINEEISHGNFSFYKHFSKEENTISTIFSDLDSGSLNYPSLIYDGPFSDALSTKEPKELTGQTYDETSGKDVIKGYIQNQSDIKTIAFGGMAGGKLSMLSYTITMNSGATYYAEITTIGGKLCSLDMDKSVGQKSLSSSEGAKMGTEYLASVGVANMAPVWSAEFDNILFVNYATKKDDVIIYSELIKVKIALDTGEILGVEALNYIYNHVSDRNVSSAEVEISEEEAIGNLKSGFSVDNVKLCLIPLPSNRESLCYEVSGNYRENTYYIYIDAKSGHEVNILKVIGNLLQ